MKSTPEILEAAKSVKSLRGHRGNAVALLQEYTAKLEKFTEQAQELQSRAAEESNDEGPDDWANVKFLKGVLVHRVERLAVEMRNLSRAVSQLIEHGRFEVAIDRVELRLRLVDLESALDAALDVVRRPLTKPRKRSLTRNQARPA